MEIFVADAVGNDTDDGGRSGGDSHRSASRKPRRMPLQLAWTSSQDTGSPKCQVGSNAVRRGIV
eukprot:365602-Chlamydomonas_euryale.AAC.22